MQNPSRPVFVLAMVALVGIMSSLPSASAAGVDSAIYDGGAAVGLLACSMHVEGHGALGIWVFAVTLYGTCGAFGVTNDVCLVGGSVSGGLSGTCPVTGGTLTIQAMGSDINIAQAGAWWVYSVASNSWGIGGTVTSA